MDERLMQASCIVFDVGNVLLSFEPERVLELIPAEYRDGVRGAMFGPDWRWGAFDLGAESNEDIAQSIADKAGIPQGKDMVLRAALGFPETMRPLPLYRMIPELKRMGKKLCALTNYGEPAFTYTAERFGNLQLLDGIVVSAREKLVKPDPKIFALLTERFGVVPGESLFIDDSEANARSAAALGFRAWHYAGGDILDDPRET